MRNIDAAAIRCVKLGLSYRMILTCVFKHLKVPLDGHISLKSIPFDKFTFGRIGD